MSAELVKTEPRIIDTYYDELRTHLATELDKTTIGDIMSRQNANLTSETSSPRSKDVSRRILGYLGFEMVMRERDEQ